MLPGAAVLAAGGAVGMGVGSPIQRHVLKKGAQLFTEPEFLLGKFVTCWMWSIVLFIPLWLIFGGEVLVANPTVFWGAMMVYFMANMIIQTANLFAARYADVSLTLPYQATTPGILTVAVFLIGERPSTWGYIGIATIAIGTYIHGRLGCGSFLAYFTPLWRLFFLPKRVQFLLGCDDEVVWRDHLHLPTEIQKRFHERLRAGETKLGSAFSIPEKKLLLLEISTDERRGVRLALLSAFFGTFGLLGEAMMARHGNPAFGFSMGMVLLTAFSVIWYFVMRRKSSSASFSVPIRERIVQHQRWLWLGGFFLAIAGFLPMIASRLAPIAYTGTLKRLAIPIGVFVAARWFREKVPAGRWVTTLIITTGAMILVMDDTPAKIFDFMDRLFGPATISAGQ